MTEDKIKSFLGWVAFIALIGAIIYAFVAASHHDEITRRTFYNTSDGLIPILGYHCSRGTIFVGGRNGQLLDQDSKVVTCDGTKVTL